MSRWSARRKCHGSAFICCQHIDTPQCNGAHDPHLLGRLHYRIRVIKDRRHEKRLDRATGTSWKTTG